MNSEEVGTNTYTEFFIYNDNLCGLSPTLICSFNIPAKKKKTTKTVSLTDTAQGSEVQHKHFPLPSAITSMEKESKKAQICCVYTS